MLAVGPLRIVLVETSAKAAEPAHKKTLTNNALDMIDFPPCACVRVERTEDL
jgi:hypothetical protein